MTLFRSFVAAAGAATVPLLAWFAPSIPKAWSDADLPGYRLPLAGWGKVPVLPSEKEFYALPEYNLKTYPVYAPDKEPPGYLEHLKAQDPKPLIEVDKLKTEADWIAAGKEVFYGRELPRFSGSEHSLQMIRDPKVLAAYRLTTTKEGILVGLRYVVRQKGQVELGTDTCSMCHVHTLPDGTLIEGPANARTPFGPLMGDLTRRYEKISPQMLEDRRRKHMREDYRVPFLKPDPNLPVADLPAEEIAKYYDWHPLGVHGRTGTSLLHPVKISNLIGLRDMRYFDHTGTSRQRGISDLMRYSTLIGDVSDALTRYGDTPDSAAKLEYMGLGQGIRRTPDAMLYALATYIYSLKPPANPNPATELTRQGQKVFQATGCSGCHTPPFYTNNKLTLAKGFTPPEATRRQVDLMPVSVGTDPELAMTTRKGTGFYRVPSLRMLWLEHAFLHDGSIGSLEELFDKRRLDSSFRSSNWHPTMPAHAVEGHTFGLDLKESDKKALIAFLRTL